MEDVHGDVSDVIAALGSFDGPFLAWRQSGPPEPTAAALVAFWSHDSLAIARERTGAPHTDWYELADAVIGLARDDQPDGVDWSAVVDRATELGATDSLAAAAAALYGLAGWQRTASYVPLDDGWFDIPPLVAELLLDAGG